MFSTEDLLALLTETELCRGSHFKPVKYVYSRAKKNITLDPEPEVIAFSDICTYNANISKVLRLVLLQKRIKIYAVKSFRDFRDFRDFASDDLVKLDLNVEDRRPRVLDYTRNNSHDKSITEFELENFEILLHKKVSFSERNLLGENGQVYRSVRKHLWTPIATKVALAAVT